MLCIRVVTLPRPSPPSASLRVDLSAHPPTHYYCPPLRRYLVTSPLARTYSLFYDSTLTTATAACPRADESAHPRALPPRRAFPTPKHLSQPFGARPTQRRRLRLISTYHSSLDHRSSLPPTAPTSARALDAPLTRRNSLGLETTPIHARPTFARHHRNPTQ